MSNRLYPLYQKGSPQLRVFLPNFWMKLIRPTHSQPANIGKKSHNKKICPEGFCMSLPPDLFLVQFACSMEMTKIDVQNYLEKIYKVPVIEVRTRIDMGKTYKEPGRGYVMKKDDTKMAYVTLVSGIGPVAAPRPRPKYHVPFFQPKDQKFEYPSMFDKTSDAKEEHEKSLRETKDNYNRFLDRTKARPGAPGWFSF